MEAVMSNVQPFFDWLVQTTLIASVVICLILAAQKMLGAKLGPRWCHALWLVLLIRMVLPWSPSSRVSLSNLIPSWDRQIQPQQLPETAEQPQTSQPAETSDTTEAIPAQRPESDVAIQKQVTPEPQTPANIQSEPEPRLVSLRRVLPILWLSGAAVIAAYLLMSNFTLWRIIKRERPLVNQAMLELFEECKARMGVQTPVVIVPSSQIRSPALFGFVRPRLLLPLEMLQKASHEEMQYVFLHELAHLKRHDIYLGWLTSILQVLHWFNPLVWFAFYRMRTDREFACDALVLARTQKEQSQEYGQAIVSLVRRFSRSRPLPAMAGILESKSQLKRRITMIAKFKKKSYQWSPLAVILIVILACVSLPDAMRTKASETSRAESAPHITLRQVWSGRKVDAWGAPSLDGRYLSYVDWKTGDLAVRELATGATRRLTNKGTWKQPIAFADNSAISPDNRLVAYSWMNKYGTFDLCVIGMDGSGDRAVCSSRHHEVYPTCWSSDGRRIGATRYPTQGAKEHKFEIISVSVEDESIAVLKTFEKKFWPRFCYSPDDRFLTYDFPVADNSENYDISLVWTDGSGEIPLVKHPANDRLLGWVPSRDEVLFTSDRAGTDDIWALRVVNGKIQGSPRPITRDIGQIQPRGFTQDGSFYFSRFTRRFTTQIAPFDPQTGRIEEELSTPILGSNFDPEWSPDGESLAYVTEKARPAGPGWYHRPLHVRNLKTGRERELASEMEAIKPRWSGDGRSILVTGYDSNKRNQKDYNGGIYKIDVRDGHVTELVQFPPVEVWSRDNWLRSISEWALDAKAVFYKKRGTIVRRELESGVEKPLYGNNGLVWLLKLSPDGKRLAFAAEILDGEKASILVMPVSGGEAREIFEFTDPNRGMRIPMAVAWTPDANYILIEKRERKGSTVWRVPSEGGDPEMIWRSKDRVTGLSVHPNGEKIAVSTIMQERAVWVMENFLPGAPVAKPEPTTTLRKVTYTWGGYATLSPDGRYMCDVDWATGTERLVLRELATGNVSALTNSGHPEYAAISPNSTQVAYLSYDSNWVTPSLFTVGIDGSDRRLINHGNCLVPKDWSVDGKDILAIEYDKDPKQLVWVSATDGSIRRIISLGNVTWMRGEGIPGKFDVSPDGRFVAYDRRQNEDTTKRDIFLFDLQDNRESVLSQHRANDRLLGWTPDGQSIFFASDRAGTWDAWLQRVTNGVPQGFPELIKQNIGDIVPIGFAQGGSFYYQTSGKPIRDVFVATLDLDKGRAIASPMPVCQTGKSNFPDWSPDGRELAYCTGRPGESKTIHVRDIATGKEREIDTEMPIFAFLRWSADGRSILGATGEEPPHSISQIDVQTGQRTILVEDTTVALKKCELFDNGKKLLFVRQDPNTKTTRLVIRDLATDSEEAIIQFDRRLRFGPFALSPDKQWLAYGIMARGTRVQTLHIAPVKGGEPQELLQFDESEQMWLMSVKWTPDSQDVLFVKWLMDDRGGELWRISAQGGEARKVWAWKKPFICLSVHPDGQRIAFHTSTTVDEMWVLENFLPQGMGE